MELFRNSGLAALAEAWHRLYENSITSRIWDGYCLAPDPASHSLYARFLAWLERVLAMLGRFVRESVFYRVLTSLRDLYFRVTKNSLIFSYVNRISLHGWLLVAFAFYLPINVFLRRAVPPLASAWEELFIIAAAMLVFWRALTKQAPGVLSRATTLETGLMLYMVVGLLLMLLVRPFPYIAAAGWRAQFEYIVWFFLLLRLMDGRRDAKILLYSFLGMVFLLSLHGIYQFIIGVPIPSSWVAQAEMGVRTRVFTIIGSPNIFGSLLVMAAPTAAALMYYVKKPWQKIAFLCVTGSLCLCDLFTFSRGSWVGLIAAIVIFAMYVDKRLLILMLTAMGGVLAFSPTIAARLSYLFTNDYAEAAAAGGRSVRWETGLSLLRENSPWLGFGLGRFGGAVAMNNQVLDKTKDFEYFYMDNYYLKTLVEMGYLGLGAFILAIIIFVFAALKAIKQAGRYYKEDRSLDPLVRNAGNDKLLCVGIFAGLAGVLVHCYFENIFEETYMMAYFWGLAAVMLVLGFYCGKEQSKIKPARKGNLA